ncbi:ribosome production factor 1-like [Elysia marginata]|uniref:Ribosome production factor 1-like n=1 Tax=Elysia marginata TaxID=1093978 RepID=A0AAV4IUY2_9GAST|nr:ribosome production factor 1-like [Elysia marginata]
MPTILFCFILIACGLELTDRHRQPHFEGHSQLQFEGHSQLQPDYIEKMSDIIMPKIKNKLKRAEVYKQFKKEKRKAQIEERKKRKQEEKTMGDQIQRDLALDEMSPYFNQETTPKVLITTSDRPKKKTNSFCKELRKVIPNSFVKYRRGLDLKKIIPQAISRDFTDLIVINEDAGEPNGLVLCHLPNGPTAEFKLMNTKLVKELKRVGEMSEHYPEINIHNFNTRLGLTIGRMLSCLFPHRPNYKGRRVVTFHNQRDYIFFRHHRYEFKNAERVALQELGPRFILRLRSLQQGTFDSKYGMYEWIHKIATLIKYWSKLEVREVVRFLFSKGTRPSEIRKQIAETYAEGAMSRSRVYQWCTWFGEGRASQDDDPKSGRPKTSTKEENTTLVEELIKCHRRMKMCKTFCHMISVSMLPNTATLLTASEMQFIGLLRRGVVLQHDMRPLIQHTLHSNGCSATVGKFFLILPIVQTSHPLNFIYLEP